MVNKANLILTHNCNLQCRHCYINAKCSVKEDLSKVYNQTVKLIDRLKKDKINHILFTGGECTIFPKIVDLVKYAKSKGVYVEIFTNGMILNKELFNIVDKVSISIDGLEDTHNWIRNNKISFTKVCKTLEYLKEIDKCTNVQITIHNKNIDELEELSKILVNYLNIRSIKIVSLDYDGRAKQLKIKRPSKTKILELVPILFENTKYHIQIKTDIFSNCDFKNYYLNQNIILPLWFDIPNDNYFIYDSQYYSRRIKEYDINEVERELKNITQAIQSYYSESLKNHKYIDTSDIFKIILKGEKIRC